MIEPSTPSSLIPSTPSSPSSPSSLTPSTLDAGTGPYFVDASELRFENCFVESPVALAARNLELLRNGPYVIARQSPRVFRQRLKEVELRGRRLFLSSCSGRGKLPLYNLDSDLVAHDALWAVPARVAWRPRYFPIHVDYVRYVFYLKARPVAETLAARFVILWIDPELGFRYSVRAVRKYGLVRMDMFMPEDCLFTFNNSIGFSSAFDDNLAVRLDANYARDVFADTPLLDMHAHTVGHYTLITPNDDSQTAIMVPSTRLYRDTPAKQEFDAGVTTPASLGIVLRKDEDGRFIVPMPNPQMHLPSDLDEMKARVRLISRLFTGDAPVWVTPTGVVS